MYYHSSFSMNSVKFRKYSNFAIIVLNGNTRPYQSVIRVPYYHKCASVFDQKGKILPFQVKETNLFIKFSNYFIFKTCFF